MKKKKAFTLAEVLVTLAVIGVVASLTIPTVVKNHQKQQWVSSYKTTFNIVSQATRMIMADNGGTVQGIWLDDDSDPGMYNTYLPYLKTIKTCNNLTPKGNCFASSYTYLNGGAVNPDGRSVILTNGASIAFKANDNTIFIDTNNFKGPNVRGKDLYVLKVLKESNEIKPANYNYTDFNIRQYCSSDLASSQGVTCGVRILRGDYGEDY